MCMHSCKSDQKMYVNIKYCQLSIVDVIIISTNLNQNTRKTTQIIFRYIINHRYYISFFIDISLRGWLVWYTGMVLVVLRMEDGRSQVGTWQQGWGGGVGD